MDSLISVTSAPPVWLRAVYQSHTIPGGNAGAPGRFQP